MPSSPHRRASSVGMMPSPRRSTLRHVALLAALVAAAGLGGCASADKFAPPCPSLSLLKDAADITRFRSSGRDVTDMVLDGRITAVAAKCGKGEGNTVAATIQVQFNLTRGPASPNRNVTVPYFVAVMRDSKIVDKQEYALSSQYPGNTDSITVNGPDINLLFPVTPTVSAAAYQIFVGYSLTPDELAFNRRRGSR